MECCGRGPDRRRGDAAARGAVSLGGGFGADLGAVLCHHPDDDADVSRYRKLCHHQLLHAGGVYHRLVQHGDVDGGRAFGGVVRCIFGVFVPALEHAAHRRLDLLFRHGRVGGHRRVADGAGLSDERNGLGRPV